ncbi:L-2-amino-thiazoline-4-carboxylic acid hydrolase [Solidesulfovibrio sp.]|uniref:L-2-amino-thiazoline-4-carboxylic acid hydrolase n=1 Tax=Solidesulfovibrio sp. TaxID=2910990 RepID=UPI002617D8C8|nr:L-2-amino-thiazoline-4-carboxylic acid hydrolase [Solidesulfovibrio sp.]
MTLLEQRRIEAAVLAQTYAVLAARLGREDALAVIEDVVRGAALAAGKAFAASAPHGPGLEHFAAVAGTWQAGGALVIENVRRDGNTFSFDVTRCRYAEAYREMGLPEELATRISCLRDGAFVAGYSEKLKLSRPETIASGASCCPFTFTWNEA